MPNKSNRKKPRSLFAAIMARDVERVRELLDAGANVNEQEGANPMTPLHWAALYASAASVALLLRRGASVHARTIDGDTALHFAAISGRTANAELLIEAGAALGAQMRGRTPLYFAAYYSHLDTSALLIAYNPENAPLDAATLEALRTNFDPAALSSAVALALAARRDDIRRRRLNVLAAYYENRGGRRTSRRSATRKGKARQRRRLTKRRRV